MLQRLILVPMVMYALTLRGVYAEDVPAIDMSGFKGKYVPSAVSFTKGWEFDVLADVTVTQLGVFDVEGEGPNHDVPIAIWTAGRKIEVLRGVVPAGKGGTLRGKCRFVSVPRTTLAPGSYVIGAFFEKNSNLGQMHQYFDAFDSLQAIRWRSKCSVLADVPTCPKGAWSPFDNLPGEFGPNFTVFVDDGKADVPLTHYAKLPATPQATYGTFIVPKKLERRGHPGPCLTTVTLFAAPDGTLTQILLEGEPLGTGDGAHELLAKEMLRLNPPRDLRPTILIACSDNVRAMDLRKVMATAYRADGREGPGGRIGTGCDVIPLAYALQHQRSRDGKFIVPDRFRDAGDYVEDRWTGLLWQKDGNDSKQLRFEQLAHYTENLQLGGVTGWRLPTEDELASIFPATFAPFQDTPYNSKECCAQGEHYSSYWTSEVSGREGNEIAGFFHWYHNGGVNNALARSNVALVRCVRGPLAPHEKQTTFIER